MARPTKCTPERIMRLCELVEIGVSVETACAAVGISRSTFYEWMSRGRAGEEGFAHVYDLIVEAVAVADVRDIEAIDRAAKAGDWRAAAWKYNRRHPEQHAREAVTGPVLPARVVHFVEDDAMALAPVSDSATVTGETGDRPALPDAGDEHEGELATERAAEAVATPRRSHHRKAKP